MESSSLANILRWNISPSPTKSDEPIITDKVKVVDDDLEMEMSFNSQQEHDIHITSTNAVLFPFNSFSALPHPQVHQPQFELNPTKSTGNAHSSMVNLLNQREVDGVLLTWQDLWVTVSAGKNRTHPILQGLSGYAQPGEVLAIMGPSGCGKSTFLDALAGRLHSSIRQSGQILVNGRTQRLALGTS
ncbi:Abc transporter g family member, partial [Thalictrum thalictroides]